MAVSHKKLASWYLQVAQNLEAGITLAEAMRMAGGLPSKDISKMASELTAGNSIDGMLQKSPRWLPQSDRYLISAAGSSGRLPETLHKLNEKHLQASENISKAVIATIYPLAVLHLGMFLFPVLDMVEFNADSGTSLHLDQYLSNLTPIILPFWIVLAGIIVLLKKGNPFIKGIMRCIPGLRGFRKSQSLADFSFALEAFIKAGAPIDEAWYGSGLVSGDPALTRYSLKITQEIKKGKLPGAALETSNVFPRDFIALYQGGEQTGKLDANLGRIARQYQDKANKQLAMVSFWYPKLLFLILAIFIAYKVIGYYSQYFEFINSIIE